MKKKQLKKQLKKLKILLRNKLRKVRGMQRNLHTSLLFKLLEMARLDSGTRELKKIRLSARIVCESVI